MKFRGDILVFVCLAAVLSATSSQSGAQSGEGKTAPPPQDVRFAVKVELVRHRP
jgi:hypothetical protein